MAFLVVFNILSIQCEQSSFMGNYASAQSVNFRGAAQGVVLEPSVGLMQ